MKPIKFIKLVLTTIATALIIINCIGLVTSLRNSEIYSESSTLFKNDISLTEEEVIQELDKKELSDKEYAIKANETINNGIAHYWVDEGISKYNLRIPFYENYILFTASYISPSSFEKYEYCDYRKALERGVGLCSQHSIILSEFLSANDINNRIVGLSGHVVVMAQIDAENDIWWILDPDYGVTIKYNLDEIEENPAIIREFYLKKGYSSENVDMLIDIFEKDGNSISTSDKTYCSNKKYYFERLSYISIWLIPILILLVVRFKFK